MQKKWKVFLSEYIHPAAKEFLLEHSEVLDRQEELYLADAVLSRNLGIDQSFLNKATKLKVIGIHGSGMDGVDLMAVKNRGIEVFSTPYLNAQSVAELIVAFALNLSRKLQTATHHIEKIAAPELKGKELMGKQVGFLGTGAIANCAAKIFCHGFGLKAIGYSPSYTEKKAKNCLIAYAPDIQTVLKCSDYLCICMPLNEQTKGLIGERELTLMKPQAYLINCARGGIVDEKALWKSLKNGEIAGAACDVFQCEPISSAHPLLSLDNFIATPHIGGNTEEALYRVGMEVVKGIIQRLRARTEE